MLSIEVITLDHMPKGNHSESLEGNANGTDLPEVLEIEALL
jgi:hypothetical protein